jgi:vacuolar-type H+-ATPase subunit F/Vma7
MDCFVIAGPEVTLGFALAGVGGRAVATAEEARSAWVDASSAGARLVLVSEEVWAWLADDLSQATAPLVALVPPFAGPRNRGPSLGTLIRQAVGIPV